MVGFRGRRKTRIEEGGGGGGREAGRKRVEEAEDGGALGALKMQRNLSLSGGGERAVTARRAG